MISQSVETGLRDGANNLRKMSQDYETLALLLDAIIKQPDIYDENALLPKHGSGVIAMQSLYGYLEQGGDDHQEANQWLRDQQGVKKK